MIYIYKTDIDIVYDIDIRDIYMYIHIYVDFLFELPRTLSGSTGRLPCCDDARRAKMAKTVRERSKTATLGRGIGGLQVGLITGYPSYL